MFINVAVVTQNWNNTAPNVYVSTTALISSIWFTKNSAFSMSVHFHKNSLIVALCIIIDCDLNLKLCGKNLNPQIM